MTDTAAPQAPAPPPVWPPRREDWLLLAPAVFIFILPFTHTVALRLLALFFAFGSALWLWRRLDAGRPPCLPAWGLWLAAALLSLLTAVDLKYSAGEIKTEIGYGLLAFVSLYVLAQLPGALRKLCIVLAIGFSAMLALALLNYAVDGYWNPDGRQGGVGTFSTWLITIAPAIAVWLWNVTPGRPRRRMVMLTLVFGLGAAALSQNRMFWVALGAEAAVFALLLWPRARWRGLPAALLALALATGAGLWHAQGGRSAANSGNPAYAFQNDPRHALWEESLKRIQASPWQGVGFGRASYFKAWPEIQTRLAPIPAWHAHNQWLNALAQMGLPGALALLGLFACLGLAFWRLYRIPDAQLRCLGAAGLTLLTGVLVKNMTDDFFNRDLALLFWALCGLWLGHASGRLRREGAPPPLCRCGPAGEAA
jgi:O-antigen ligase